jgi:hypothetical protein
MSSGIIERKVRIGKIFKCKNLSTFISSVIQMLDFKGFSMSRFFICEYEGVTFLTKLMFYKKSAPEIYGRTNGSVVNNTDAEINILQVLKDKIINAGVSPCILEILYYHICQDISKITPSEKICDAIVSKKDSVINSINSTFCQYADLVSGGLAHDKCAFVIMEKCDIPLHNYLKKYMGTPISVEIIKSLLFQIIYTLYAIKRIYPKFHHYDLHTENIMLNFNAKYKFKLSNQKFLVFRTHDTIFSIPYFGIIAKIIDFGFSEIPEEDIISDATKDRVNMFHRSDNDLLFLFYWISKTLDNEKTTSNKDILEILSKLDPTESYILYNTERIRNRHDIPTYEDMLYNDVFKEYHNLVPLKQIYGDYKIT